MEQTWHSSSVTGSRCCGGPAGYVANAVELIVRRNATARRRPRSGSPFRSLRSCSSSLLVAPLPVRSPGRPLRDRRDDVVHRRPPRHVHSRHLPQRPRPLFLFGLLEDRRQSVAGLAIALGAGGVVTLNDPNRSGATSPGRPDLQHLMAGRIRHRAEARAGVGSTGARRAGRARTRGGGAGGRCRGARADRTRAPRHRWALRQRDDGAGGRRAEPLEPDQEREREALQVIEQTGREALAEMRRLVGVLRRPEEAPALAPQPSLEHVDKLVAQAREAGLPVDLRVEGDPVPAPGRRRPDRVPPRPGRPHERDQARERRARRRRRSLPQRDRRTDGLRRRPRRRRRRRRAGTGSSACASGCPSTAASLDAGPRPEGGYSLRARLPVQG